ncbi:MAG: AAA family ATPase [Sphingomonas sp.]|uniref:ATP-binding protein n=1 Tax=Sphingomonas sp. TaxID=28214 RepID=UPI002628A11C|nr:AAA family ATPase [Sphingomonas sp.]MDK2768084.1 AAA family ATPase [Sphingomonas sp.]
MSGENLAAEEVTPAPITRPLHLLTTDILLADLISGRAIATDQGQAFSLATDHARAVLNWYRLNRAKWAANLALSDCEAIVDSIAKAPPVLAAQAGATAATKRTLRLVKLVAHRFGGLHAYGDAAGAPEDFVFEPDKAITLFEGWNGSGKTSIANAIIWCLTGKILRAQRLPDDGDKEYSCTVDRDDADPTDHLLTPVTPLPQGGVWTPDASAKTVPADTWVELSFVDEDGNALPPIRRTQSRKPNGKLAEDAPDPAQLGVDPIAFRMGTTMPGMLPYLQVGSASELGQAVAKLTGLADLVDLAKHAGKAMTRISGPITTDRKTERDTIEQQFLLERRDLEERITAFPDMKPEAALPRIADTDAEDAIGQLLVHFDTLKANGLAAAKEVLGDGFDAENAEQRADLESCIAPASEQLQKITKLASIERLARLKLDPADAEAAGTLLGQLHEEAGTLAELAGNPTLARRTQLYARVAAWKTEHADPHDAHCAVCRAPLDGVIDPETGIGVGEHLEQVRKDSALISRTIKQWAEHWTGLLARDLPAPLRAELDRDLPASPGELFRAGLTEELFATDPFSGTLAALRPGVEALVTTLMADLPAFEEPEAKALPAILQPHVAALEVTLGRIERATGFVGWMTAHREAMLAALSAVRSGPEDGEAPSEAIGPKLDKLDFIVKGVAPMSAAIELTGRMAKSLANYGRKLERIQACQDAAAALETIVPMGSLAQAQVEGLREQLHDRAEFWRDQLYRSATSFAPAPRQTLMDAKGVIDIQVGRDGVRAPAQHVSNASALRAGLFGFFLAFRENVLKNSGGLSLLVLDDPQDLLDVENRQRLSSTVARLAAGGAQIFATTHDRQFARTLVAEARSKDLIEHRAIHPVHASRATMETSLAKEDLDRKREDFLKHVDSAPHAQDYANEARIYLETRLGDLFDDPAYPAYSAAIKAPTLNPLFDRLRGLVGSKANDLFMSPVLTKFCADKAMISGAEPRRILNESHHNKTGISYADVQRVDADLKRLRIGIEEVHEEFRRYRLREKLTETQPSNVVALRPARVPKLEIPVCQDIAAFTRHMPSGGSQAEDCELFSTAWFEDKSFFFVRHNTLGFAIPSGAVAIVENEPSPGRDHNLVIARRGKQIYARRLLRPANGDGLSLAAEAPDPQQSRPTLAFANHGTEIHRVVGALFVNMPPPEGRDEATEIDSVPALARVEVAYRVREESAVPLALPGQTSLGGPRLTAQDLNGREGELVAVTLDDGTSIFKRVGQRVGGGLHHLRQFETIGGLGESAVIATEQVEGGPDLPVMLFARPVIGVIYDL